MPGMDCQYTLGVRLKVSPKGQTIRLEWHEESYLCGSCDTRGSSILPSDLELTFLLLRPAVTRVVICFAAFLFVRHNRRDLSGKDIEIMDRLVRSSIELKG
jgi:hypothetical protein